MQEEVHACDRRCRKLLLLAEEYAGEGATLPTAIVSGTYKTTTYSSGTYTFPSPAPAYPYLSGALSTFNGSNPTGSWSLYVRDDANSDSPAGNAGVIEYETTAPPLLVGVLLVVFVSAVPTV